MRHTLLIVSLIAGAALTGCIGTGQDSSVVKEFVAASGSDPATLTTADIAQYLHSHDSLENKLRQPCAALSASAHPDWAQTAEGKLCIAVKQAAFFHAVTEDHSDKHSF